MAKPNKSAVIVKCIDPPQGWIYGFPKAIPEEVVDIKEWLINNGYPKQLIDHFGEQFQYRIVYFETKYIKPKKTQKP